MDSAGRNDTRNQPRVDAPQLGGSSGTTGECSSRNAVPRAAGAASTRGVQPSGQRPRRIVICGRCRKRLMQVRNGEWYHERHSSAFCDYTDGTHRKAIPLEVEVQR